MSARPTISFARGVPSLDLIDVAGLAQAASAVLVSDPAGATGYGDPQGYGPLRDWIAQRYNVNRDHVLVTNGSLQACSFVFDEFVTPGSDVVVENPTYDRTLVSLAGRDARIHGLAMESGGIRTDALKELLESGIQPSLAHIIPTFHNPSGGTLTLEARKDLIRLVTEHRFMLFEDDPYFETRFSGQDLPKLIDLDDSGMVLHASSFSKVLSPGLRVGYLVGTPQTINAITARAFNAYLTPGTFAQAVVYEYCSSGLMDAALAKTRSALQSRMQRLADCLRGQLPQARFEEPEGGYFLWVKLPDGTDVARLQELAMAEGVEFIGAESFASAPAGPGLRLAYAGLNTDEIDEGVNRLAKAYRSL